VEGKVHASFGHTQDHEVSIVSTVGVKWALAGARRFFVRLMHKAGVPIPDAQFQKLRKLAAELIQKNQLPVIVASKTLFEGYGHGLVCSLCAQPITPTQIEYELADGTSEVGDTRLHMWCHAAW